MQQCWKISGYLGRELQILGFWGWVLRVLICKQWGFLGTCGVPREGIGADFRVFESKLRILELRAMGA